MVLLTSFTIVALFEVLIFWAVFVFLIYSLIFRFLLTSKLKEAKHAKVFTYLFVFVILYAIDYLSDALMGHSIFDTVLGYVLP